MIQDICDLIHLKQWERTTRPRRLCLKNSGATQKLVLRQLLYIFWAS